MGIIFNEEDGFKNPKITEYNHKVHEMTSQLIKELVLENLSPENMMAVQCEIINMLVAEFAMGRIQIKIQNSNNNFCDCGSNSFFADINDGTMTIQTDDNGEIIDSETDVSEHTPFICEYCGKKMKIRD